MLQYLDTIIAIAVVMLGLSLIITILNQIVSSFLSYRGTNLRWGIQTMLLTIAPTLGTEAKKIANEILTQPIVSDSIMARFKDWEKVRFIGPFILRWKLASAIGPDTLIRSLKKVSEARGGQGDLDSPLQPGSPPAGSPPDADRTANVIDRLLDDLDPEAARKLRTMHAAFAALAPDYSVKVDDFLVQMGNSTQQSVGKIEAWFNVAMNRVSQRFTMQIRIWTVIFAFLLAFTIHLDSLELANQLFKNPALRAKLVEQSGAMLNEAAAILGTDPSGGNEPTTSPEVLKSKMEVLRDNDIRDINKEYPAQLGAVPEFKKLSDAETWLLAGLKDKLDENRKNQLVTKYKGLVVQGLKDKAKDVIGLLKDAGIELAPRPLPTWYSPTGWIGFFKWDGKRNLVGILLTAALLSLGAPFWYNALKTLTNLRPMVAQRQDQQKKDAA